MMEAIIEDLFKIYLASVNSYNSKIYQILNDKYRHRDGAFVYLTNR